MLRYAHTMGVAATKRNLEQKAKPRKNCIFEIKTTGTYILSNLTILIVLKSTILTQKKGYKRNADLQNKKIYSNLISKHFRVSIF